MFEDWNGRGKVFPFSKGGSPVSIFNSKNNLSGVAFTGGTNLPTAADYDDDDDGRTWRYSETGRGI